MAEQPQPWGEHTLEVTPQDPWAQPSSPPTQPIGTGPFPPMSGPPMSGPPMSGRPMSGPPMSGRPTSGHPLPGAPTSGSPHAGGPRGPEAHAFSRGVAHVKPAMPRTESFTAAHEPTGTGWPDAEPPRPRPSLGEQLRQLRLGGEWSSAAVLFAFICWGIWTISGDGDLTTPLLVFAVTLAVALGLFALSRLVGRIVLERQMGRVRRTAHGSHLVVAVFLVGVGVAYLRQVTWVMDAWGWITGVLFR